MRVKERPVGFCRTGSCSSMLILREVGDALLVGRVASAGSTGHSIPWLREGGAGAADPVKEPYQPGSLAAPGVLRGDTIEHKGN